MDVFTGFLLFYLIKYSVKSQIREAPDGMSGDTELFENRAFTSINAAVDK